jgi:hypothetical protein
MTEQTSTSAVRDAARLIAAAEELLAEASDPAETAAHVADIALAAKSLRANHLDDALDHVTHRAERVAETRRRGWLLSEPVAFDEEGPSASQDSPSEPEASTRAARHAAAVDELVGDPGAPDPEALRARVHGQDEG